MSWRRNERSERMQYKEKEEEIGSNVERCGKWKCGNGNIMTRNARETMNTDKNRNKTCRRMSQ